MERKSLAVLAFSVLAVSALAGCGGGSGGGGGGSGSFSTSLPSSSPVDTLSPSQATQLCDDINNYVSKLITTQNACQLAAVEVAAEAAAQDSTLTDQELQEECTAFAALACSTSADAGVTGVDGGTSSCGSTAGCTATVGQVSDCLNAAGPALSQWEAMFPSCSSITRAKLASLQLDAGPMEPAACTILDNDCPSFSPM